MEPLFHLAWIWVAVFAANILARKTRLTPVVWFLAMGALLSNTGITPETSDDFIPSLAMLGIILIMFALGFEEKTDNFLHSVKKSWGIAFFGAAGPFLAAYAVAALIRPDRPVQLQYTTTSTRLHQLLGVDHPTRS